MKPPTRPPIAPSAARNRNPATPQLDETRSEANAVARPKQPVSHPPQVGTSPPTTNTPPGPMAVSGQSLMAAARQIPPTRPHANITTMVAAFTPCGQLSASLLSRRVSATPRACDLQGCISGTHRVDPTGLDPTHRARRNLRPLRERTDAETALLPHAPHQRRSILHPVSIYATRPLPPNYGRAAAATPPRRSWSCGEGRPT